MLGNEASAEVTLELLGAFELTCCGSSVRASLGAQRLLAFLGLRPDGVHRSAAAEQLWPDYPCHRAAANLRSALCQGRRACCVTLIDCIGQRLRVAPVVRVDVLGRCDAARQIIDGPGLPPSEGEDLIAEFTRELLPGWPDEWLTSDRERWNQMRLYALESLAQQLLTARQYLPALQAALAATAIDPIRETAHRTVIEVHLAEGNVASAVRCYQHYEAYLQQELRVSPSPQMTDLLQGLPYVQGDRHRRQLSAPQQAAAPASDRLRGQAGDSPAPRRGRNAW
ncbi:BTAD domain-containing putative transcriptional regulator [Streptomyces sp. NPDC000983]|uniref:AfsR/SARP family transcriptional regulator n=1 Tax=Streptomyces sp. NPDC000983 TaxID=3154373 RepID=UPI0033187B59